ncbi:MAG: hypothetical protein IIU11_05125, partial [Bacteroidales bacterium]|nr:hypothetical protein [Bacteroidales bacterium]
LRANFLCDAMRCDAQYSCQVVDYHINSAVILCPKFFIFRDFNKLFKLSYCKISISEKCRGT